MTKRHMRADLQQGSAVHDDIAAVRRFLKLFSAWVFQALCSELPQMTRVRLESAKGRAPDWRLFLNRLPNSRDDAAIGLASDLDGVLSLISSGRCPTFQWVEPWARLYRTLPEARPVLTFAGLELAEAFRKVKEPCKQKYIEQAVLVYHEDEAALHRSFPSEANADALLNLDPAILVGRQMLQIWLHGFDPVFQAGRALIKGGSFGPGAVAERCDHVDRATMLPAWVPVYHRLIEPTFFKSCEEWRTWMLTHDWAEPPRPFSPSTCSRMVAVPKTSTKPRLIAAEPAAHSWIQQGLRVQLERAMARYPYLDITDQTHNQRLCLRGLATIDQSRASDRVADGLIRLLFPPKWVQALEACRTGSVHCLCGKTHDLAKYAGMGSAATFPVETLVFAACALSHAYLADGGSPWDDRRAIRGWLDLQAESDSWGFYGDDAVVPCNLAETVSDGFQAWGFIPNLEKSYTAPARFRESCGVMAALVHNQWIEVSPVRFSSWPSQNLSVSQSFHTVAALNQIRLKILLLSGCLVGCNRKDWTKIPEGNMLWDYSNMKDLLWSPRGLCWWNGSLLPVTPSDYQENWSLLGQSLTPGAVCHSVCAKDGEIPPSALYVCLSRITGPARAGHSEIVDDGSTKWLVEWDFPLEPSPMRDPRPYKVVVQVGR